MKHLILCPVIACLVLSVPVSEVNGSIEGSDESFNGTGHYSTTSDNLAGLDNPDWGLFGTGEPGSLDGAGQVFDFQWLSGDPNTAFVAPNSVVLSREFARRLFGTDQVLGKPLTIEGYQPSTVTGVLEDFPKNSSIHFILAVSTAT